MSTALDFDPATIIRLYALRSRIEVAFKQAMHTVGARAYHFWLRAMTPRPRHAGHQYLHRRPPTVRHAVARKLAAYQRHLQLGLIAQGLLQCLAVTQPQLVWHQFGSWLRTARVAFAPSEAVTASALRHTLPELLVGGDLDGAFARFLQSQLDPERAADLRLAA